MAVGTADRPKMTRLISFLVEESVRDRLEELAARNERSVSAEIRLAVAARLEAEEAEVEREALGG